MPARAGESATERGCADLLRKMEAHPLDARVQGEACIAMVKQLAKIFTEGSAVGSSTTAAASAGVQSAMRVHRGDAGVQVACFLALEYTFRLERHRTTTKTVQRSVASQGVLLEVSRSLQFHPSDVKVQHAGLSVIANIASDEEFKLELVASPLIFGMLALQALQAHPGELTVVLTGLWCLYNFTCHNRSTSVHVMASRPLPAVLRAMGKHPDNVQVQAWGCSIVRKMNFANEEALVVLSCATVVKAMRTHADSAFFMRNACSSLCNITEHIETAALTVARMSGVTILACMRKFPGDPAVQDSACMALYFMSAHLAAAAHLVELGAEHDVLKVLRSSRADGRVQEALLTLYNLVLHGSTDMTERLVTRGAGGAVQRVMRAHPEDPVIQASACSCLGQFASASMATTNQLLRLGVSEDILAAIEANPGEAKFTARACKALSCLLGGGDIGRAGSDAQNLHILEGEAASVVIEAMRRHRTSAYVQEVACEVLAVLCRQSEVTRKDMAERLMDMSAGNLVIEAMRAHADVAVDLSAAWAVASLAHASEPARLQLAELGAVDVLSKASQSTSQGLSEINSKRYTDLILFLQLP